VPLARNFSFGKQLSSVLAPHLGMPYQDIVQALRTNIPKEVQQIVGRVTNIDSGPVSTVHLDDGQTIAAKLVIMATGLNTKLCKRLGIDYEMISEQHSTTVGFDIRSSRCAAADTPVLVFYGNDLRDGLDYLTIFPCKDVLRGNLFLYRDPLDPWIRRLRQAPRETLLEVLPTLAAELGDFTIEHVQCRPSDVAVARHHQRDGMVLIGDAYQTPCPAAGTGISRLLVDVERLAVHAARWIATDDTSSASLQSYYNDAVKLRSDRAAIREARFRRSIATNSSVAWALRRRNVKARRFVKYVLHSLRDRVAHPGWMLPPRPASDRGIFHPAWPFWSRHADQAGAAQASEGPNGTSGAS